MEVTGFEQKPRYVQGISFSATRPLQEPVSQVWVRRTTHDQRVRAYARCEFNKPQGAGYATRFLLL